MLVHNQKEFDAAVLAKKPIILSDGCGEIVRWDRPTIASIEVERRGATVKGDLYLVGATVEGDVSLSGATVEGDVSLSCATVKGNVSLRGATVKGDWWNPLSYDASEVVEHLRCAQISVDSPSDDRATFERLWNDGWRCIETVTREFVKH